MPTRISLAALAATLVGTGCFSEEPPSPTTPPAQAQEPVDAPTHHQVPVSANAGAPTTAESQAPRAVEPHPPAGTPAPAEARPSTTPAPSSTDAVRQLLQARHTNDLPKRAVLDQHDDAELALRWLALHDELSMIRARAAERLGFYDSSEGFLIVTLTDTAQPDAVRAGVILGLAKLGLSDHVLARAAVMEQVSSPSPRLGLEAAVALLDVPEAADELRALADDPSVDPAVRAKISGP